MNKIVEKEGITFGFCSALLRFKAILLNYQMFSFICPTLLLPPSPNCFLEGYLRIDRRQGDPCSTWVTCFRWQSMIQYQLCQHVNNDCRAHTGRKYSAGIQRQFNLRFETPQTEQTQLFAAFEETIGIKSPSLSNPARRAINSIFFEIRQFWLFLAKVVYEKIHLDT